MREGFFVIRTTPSSSSAGRWPEHFLRRPRPQDWLRELEVFSVDRLLELARSPELVWSDAMDRFKGPTQADAFERVCGFSPTITGAWTAALHTQGVARELWAWPAVHLLLVAEFSDRKRTQALRAVLEAMGESVDELIRDGDIDRRSAGLVAYSDGRERLRQILTLHVLANRRASEYRWVQQGAVAGDWRDGLLDEERVHSILGEWKKTQGKSLELQLDTTFELGAQTFVMLYRPLGGRVVENSKGEMVGGPSLHRTVLRFERTGGRERLRIATDVHPTMAELAQHVTNSVMATETDGRWENDDKPNEITKLMNLVGELVAGMSPELDLREMTFVGLHLPGRSRLEVRRPAGGPAMEEELKQLGAAWLPEAPWAIQRLVVHFGEKDVSLRLPESKSGGLLCIEGTSLDPDGRDRLEHLLHQRYGLGLSSSLFGKPRHEDGAPVTAGKGFVREALAHRAVVLQATESMEAKFGRWAGFPHDLGVWRPGDYVVCGNPQRGYGDREASTCRGYVELKGSLLWGEDDNQCRDLDEHKLYCSEGHDRPLSILTGQRPERLHRCELNMAGVMQLVVKRAHQALLVQEQPTLLAKTTLEEEGRQRVIGWLLRWTLGGKDHLLGIVRGRECADVLEGLRNAGRVAGLALVWCGTPDDGFLLRDEFGDAFVQLGDVWLDGPDALSHPLTHPPELGEPILKRIADKPAVMADPGGAAPLVVTNKGARLAGQSLFTSKATTVRGLVKGLVRAALEDGLVGQWQSRPLATLCALGGLIEPGDEVPHKFREAMRRFVEKVEKLDARYVDPDSAHAVLLKDGDGYRLVKSGVEFVSLPSSWTF